MQIREIKDALPEPLGSLDDAITAALRARIDWRDFCRIDASAYRLSKGASETSRRVSVALDPVFAEQAQHFFSSVPLAVATLLRPGLAESDQDTIGLYPGTENLRVSSEWVYLPEGDDVGPLTIELRKIPWMHQGLLKVLLGGSVSGKLFLDGVSGLRDSLVSGDENLVPLWLQALDLHNSISFSLYERLENPLPVAGGFSRIFRCFLQFVVPEKGRPWADAWWAWIVARSYGEKGRIQLIDSVGGKLLTDKMRMAVATELERSISPVRAAGEVLQHNPRPFGKNTDEAFWLWARLKATALAEKAVGRSRPEKPLAVIDGARIYSDDKLADRLLQLAEDARFTSVAVEYRSLADIVKKLASRSGRKERAEIGAAMLAVVAAEEETLRMLAQINPANTAVSLFEGDRTQWVQAVEEGRIYGFAPGVTFDGDAVVKEDIGHLFLDMKGFTAKSVRLESRDLAEFMRWDFYDPLLKSIKKYYRGLVDLTDKGGIFINNLLGDALSLCGDVASLIEFAEESATIFGQFEDKLRQRKQQDSKKQELRQEKQDLQDKLVKLQQEVLRLKNENDTLDAASKKEKAQKIKLVYEKIQLRIAQLDRAIERRSGDTDEIPEWGTYIGWGASPVYLPFDDDVFGKLGVALAETINETARGSSRDGDLLAQLQHGFQAARHHDPSLDEIAFRVAIGQSVVVEFDIAQKKQLLASQSSSVLTASLGEELPLHYKDIIYNAGIALSAAALAAYLKQSHNLIHSGFVLIKATEVLQTLAPCWHPPEPLKFIYVEHENGRLRIFRHVGQIQFKGYEGYAKKTLWELVPDSLTVHSRLLDLMGRMQEQDPGTLIDTVLHS